MVVASESNLVFFVNGREVHPNPEHVERNLADYLRQNLTLTGTKVACGEGGCGACTVIVSKKSGKSYRHDAVNACITPLWTLQDCHVLTVEGITGGSKTCHILQDSIARNNGTQCGFCSPGIVMSAYALALNQPHDDLNALKSALEGNLCRCTGYRPVLDAFKDYSKLCNGVGDVEDICKPFAASKMEDARRVVKDHAEKIQSIEAQLDAHLSSQNVNLLPISGGNMKYYRPSNITEVFRMMRENPTLKLAGGCTELYLDTLHKSAAEFLLLDRIPELKSFERHDEPEPAPGYVKFGAALTISELSDGLRDEIDETPEWKTRGLKAIVNLLERYGSKQIRNVATIGGSLMSNNPGSDIQTFYSVLNCWAIRYDCDTETLMSRRTKIPFNTKSLVTHFEIPYTDKNEFVWMEKSTKRKHVDVSVLNAAARITMDDSHQFVEKLVIGFGGTSVDRFELDFVFEKSTVKLDDGLIRYITDGFLHELGNNHKKDTQYSLEYIKATGKNLIQKFYMEITADIGKVDKPSATSSFKSSQVFPSADKNIPEDLIGKPIVHASAYKHSTGEARYCDDTPQTEGELFLAFVLSERAHADIVDVDVTEALKVEGVVGYVSHSDAPKNSFGMVVEDEEIFASSKVTAHGQVIGGIVASDRQIARHAAKLVKVHYRDLKPLIITVEDAIDHSSFYEEQGMKLQKLVPGFKFDSCDHVLEGKMNVGSQAHFYLEPQGCIVIPKGEDDELEVISSTQNPMDVQGKIAEALDIQSNRVMVKVKRIGGGFGGKESRCLLVALPAAVAAKKFGKPVRCILDRETDMRISGKRHAFVTNYKVGFTKQGRLQGLQMKIYCNGGNTLDISEAAIERVIVNMDNAYNIGHFDLEGKICKTNTASNTVFRGTGGPQAALIIENILDRIASYLQLDPVEVRRANMYTENDVTPYGQMITNSTMRKCWDKCIQMSDYYKRKELVDAFNRKNQYTKRGITMNPCHFGIAYTAVFLNQGAALVHIYRDGSVLVTHNGVEIGQGLHTKLIQVATRELGIDTSKIRISDTSTDKVPNGTPTSASCGSDLIGMALLNACKILKDRLQSYLEKAESWESAVSAAYFDRVSLSTTGFYKTPRIGWNEQKHGEPFNYFSTGAACTEVELDCLTGHYKIIRTDIVMDVGRSLNPAIDIGQIEGAFVQGTGFFTMEELQFGGDGRLLTVGPNSYKIPTCSTAPEEFNVSILPGVSNPHAIYSSKAIGEPPLLLATSVFYAIKAAIRAFRTGRNLTADFPFFAPATPERVLLGLAGQEGQKSAC